MKSSRESSEGRVAVVTGGGRGLGRAIARGLSNAGFRVAVTAARQAEEIATIAAEFGAERMLAVTADVTREEDCARVVESTLARFGRLDILVNNAGRGMKYVSERFLTEPTRFWEVKPEVFRMVIDTNVLGPFFMSRATVPSMLRAGWGRIVNVSINRETMRRVGFSPYGPSKAALESETAIWAQDLAGSGITVNAVLPGGATATGMVPDGVPDRIRATLLNPEVILPPVLWLASMDSDGVTGKRLIANRWGSGATPLPEAIEEAGFAP